MRNKNMKLVTRILKHEKASKVWDNRLFQVLSSKIQEQGFTIIEMLVVIAIFGTMATLVVANYAGLRGPRNLKISENELVSTIRKYQSYTLSSRNLPNGKAVKFYILKFSSDTPNGYTVQAVDSDNTFIPELETVTYQSGIGYGNLRNPFILTDGLGNSIPPASCTRTLCVI